MRPIIPLNSTTEQIAALFAEADIEREQQRVIAREQAHACLARARRSRNQGRPLIARLWLHNARWWRRLSNDP